MSLPQLPSFLPIPSPAGLPAMQPFQLDPYSGFSQWVTYDQARQFAQFWNADVLGIVMLPGDDEHAPDDQQFGIYRPESVETYFPTSKTGPDGVKYYFLHARFLVQKDKTVHAGLNIGLMINQFYRYPYSSALVINDLVQQILSLPGVPFQAA